MSDLSARYREGLRELLENGSFSKEPERQRRIRWFLECWDRWALATKEELRNLDKMSSIWSLVLVVPALFFLIRSFELRKGVRRVEIELDQAQMYLDQFGREHGQTLRETEAVQAAKTDLLR